MSLQRQRVIRDYIIIIGLLVAVTVLLFYFLQMAFTTQNARDNNFRSPATIRSLEVLPSLPAEGLTTEEVYYWDGGFFEGAERLDGGALRLTPITIHGNADGGAAD